MKSIKRNAVLSMILNIVKLFIPLLVGPYLAYTLSIDSYAEYNKAVALIGWFLPIAGFGIYNFGMRNMSAYRDNQTKKNQEFSNLFILGLISTSVASIVYFIYIFILYKSDAHLLVLYLSMMIQIFSSVFNVEFINEADEDYFFITIKTIFVKLLYIITIFLFVKSSDDSILLAFLTSINVLLNNVISYLYVRKKIKFVKVSFRILITYLKPLFIMLLLINVNLFYTSLDKLMLSNLSTSDIQITYYTMSQQINSVITNVFIAIISVTIPRLSYYLSIKDFKNYEKLRTNSFHNFMMIVIPACFGLAILSDCLIYLYGGVKYIGAASTMFIFSIRTIVAVIILCMANQVVFLHRKEKVLTKLYFTCGCINFFLNLILYFFGHLNSLTVIITTMLSELILVYMLKWFIKIKIKNDFTLFSRSIMIYFFVSCAFFIISYVIRLYYPFQSNLNMNFIILVLLNVICCLLFYIVCLLLLKEKYLYLGIQKMGGALESWRKKI